MSLRVAVEGDTDIPIVEKLAADAGMTLLDVIDENGVDQLDLNVRGYNAAAKGSPWLVLRDVDADPRCPGDIIRALMANQPIGWS